MRTRTSNPNDHAFSREGGRSTAGRMRGFITLGVGLGLSVGAEFVRMGASSERCLGRRDAFGGCEGLSLGFVLRMSFATITSGKSYKSHSTQRPLRTLVHSNTRARARTRLFTGTASPALLCGAGVGQECELAAAGGDDLHDGLGVVLVKRLLACLGVAAQQLHLEGLAHR